MASIAAQRALVAEEWPPGAEVRVRMGLHTGEAAPHDGDYHTLEVHQAARVRDAAHGGQVLLSQATVSSIGGDVPNGCSVRGLGRFPLRDFDGGVELFEARHPALPASFPPPRLDGGAPQTAPLPAALVADTERGQLLRETRPVFGKGLSSQDVVALLEAADAAAS